MPLIRRLFIAGLAGLALAGPASAEGVLDRLKETGEIRLGVRTDAAPLSWMQANRPVGYTVEVCTAVVAEIAGLVGREVAIDWVVVTAENRFDAVVEGRVDLSCGADTITLERRARVNFSLPTFVDGAAVLLPRDADPEFDALAGARIGVRDGTTTEEVLRNTLEAKGMQAEVVTFADHQAGLTALENHEIAAYFGDQSILFGLFFASDMADQMVVSDNMLTVEKHGLAMPRGDDDFRLAVDTAISELYRDGRMEAFFLDSFPGATPGLALRALFLLGPDMP